MTRSDHHRLLAAACVVIQAGALASALGTPYSDINAAAASAPITVQHLRRNVTMLEGSGGNIGVLAGRDGILMVDDGIAVSREKIVRAIRSFSDGDLKYVVLTHWHWDHSDGDGWVRKAGATLIADHRTVDHLKQTIDVVEWEHTFPPARAADIPNLVLTADKTLRFDGETVKILHYGAGHTDGDLAVYFRSADVLQTGDMFWNGLYPFIDYVAGGSIDGTIRGADDSIALTTDQTIVIPGHGPVGGRADLIAYRDMLRTVRGRVAAMKAQGKSLAEVEAARPTADYDGTWGRSVISPRLFTALVYRGV
jgi:glyoxylase-like metal-dependent hydrolase (beta-lactamase superfamily II)